MLASFCTCRHYRIHFLIKLGISIELYAVMVISEVFVWFG